MVWVAPDLPDCFRSGPYSKSSSGSRQSCTAHCIWSSIHQRHNGPGWGSPKSPSPPSDLSVTTGCCPGTWRARHTYQGHRELLEAFPHERLWEAWRCCLWGGCQHLRSSCKAQAVWAAMCSAPIDLFPRSAQPQWYLYHFSFFLHLYCQGENCQIQLICQRNAFRYSWNHLWGMVERVFLQCTVIVSTSPLPFSLLSPDVSPWICFISPSSHICVSLGAVIPWLSGSVCHVQNTAEWLWEGFGQLCSKPTIEGMDLVFSYIPHKLWKPVASLHVFFLLCIN